MKEVNIIGAGLAGSEAAYQLANKGIKVNLYEQKPLRRHEAFKTDLFGELICSNSLRSNDILNGVGLLKEEMRHLDSLIMEAADACKVEAGTSLAVDRVGFAEYITNKIKTNPNITVINKVVEEIDASLPTIITSGPLTEGELSKAITKLCGQEDYLYFYDAIAPIVKKESIDFNSAYYKSRYKDDEGDYINCPLTEEEFNVFYDELINAETINVKQMDELKLFEGCMPFEEMAKRGKKTLLFGPMKPVGLEHNGIRPYGVVQLRQDNAIDSLYNIVGFQTHLTYPEQDRILKLIPALKNVEIVRHGQMHRNTYINSPKLLNSNYQFINYPNVFIAGQISGVEGYVESAGSGLYAALCMYQYLNGEIKHRLSPETMMGAMAEYISDKHIDKLVPMNANYGIIKTDFNGNKKDKRSYIASKSIDIIEAYKKNLCGSN
ncbi:MAG: methylenetetrahydrofolate--tRNA-(uracil(54)-C(5))-methyltransferase (FADH(2)-oxidizing) TrmFO [Erysipelotrichaceae bacterium]|nr:methylenetetrahydrofolate--tRNA-(uracil(54)-C(5))-methyltransferase (FADH(2)-oxidizing) TrmFO [Erysipelotrichaceae bacterium]